MCCFATFIKTRPFRFFYSPFCCTHYVFVASCTCLLSTYNLGPKRNSLSLSLSLSLSFSTSCSCYLLIYVYTKHTMRDSSSKHKGPWYNLLLKRSFEGRGKEKIYKETIKLGNTCIIINTSTHTSSNTTYKHIYARMCAGKFAFSN